MPSSRTPELVALGNAIREARNKLGLSQERLALEADLDRTFIASIEAGRRNITFGSLLKVSKALKIAPSELLRCWEKRVSYIDPASSTAEKPPGR